VTGQSEGLASHVLSFVRARHLITEGETLVVAVSGGPDSVCLLHVLASLQKELSLKLHVAHLNHQLRGADSDADAQFVAGLAKKLKLPAVIESRDVNAYRVRHRLSLEEAAREVRYAFLAQVAESVGARKVAVGHTQDDHLETILMHLIRGSGTRGLRGLRAVSQWRIGGRQLTIIRPLLEVSRRETEEYCRRHKVNPRLDASNLSLSPFRNRIRLKLLPLLRSYNPHIEAALLRMARIAADELDFLDDEVARHWDTVVRERDGVVILAKSEFLKLPMALKRHLLRAAIEKLMGNVRDIESRHIEEVLLALDKQAGKRICLPDGVTFAVDYDSYILSTSPTTLSPLPILKGESVLKVPGRTEVAGWAFEAGIIDRSQMPETYGDDQFTAYLDAERAGNKLIVRTRRRGDRFQPLGMSRQKKLGEFMIDAKIPQSGRSRIPLVCSPEGILWVVGYRIAEQAKVTDATTRVLRLEAKQVGRP